MTRGHKVLWFVLVTGLGAYGCAKGPPGAPGERSASLEAKSQRLEEDYRAAAAARDSFRQKLLAAEEKQTNLQRQLDYTRTTAAAERDALKAELTTRTAERDTMQTQYETFRKSIRELLGQAEAAANPSANPPVLVGAGSTPDTGIVPAGRN